MNSDNKYHATKLNLNKISPSFCIAKWTHVTMHLHSGQTQSCHHPPLHSINPEQIKLNPKKLHNSDFKIKTRTELLRGEFPEDCNYCWNIEKSGPEQISDRHIKSAQFEQSSEIKKILSQENSENYNPKYLEVSFSQVCNLKCVYCGPQFSSSWQAELNKFNDLTFSHISAKLIPEKNNPYIEAFWSWWPELITELKVLRVTGGEPLLAPSTYLLLEKILLEPDLDLELKINTNLSVPEEVLNKFFSSIKKIHDAKKVRSIQIITSMEASGNAAEYIRFGLNYNQFWKNVSRLRQLNICDLSITATLSILCIDTLIQFYQKTAEIRNLTSPDCQFKFLVDLSLLKEPQHLQILNFPKYFKLDLWNQLTWIIDNSSLLGLNTYEVLRVQVIANLLFSKMDTDQPEITQKLIEFLEKIDFRRGTNYKTTFPRLVALI